MNRRTLLKLVALLPWAGSTIAKALLKSSCPHGSVYIPYLPTEFPKWDRAIDGLSSAAKWARDMEWAWLPRGLVVPRAGQVWATVRDCRVDFRAAVSWEEQRTHAVALLHDFARLFGTAPLRQGERVRILSLDDPEKPLRVTFQPVRYEELHEAIVPNDVRSMPGYNGYELTVKTARSITDLHKEAGQTYFNEAFRLVEDAAEAA